MYAKVNSLGLFGIEGYPVVVECDASSGLPAFDIVGLPDAAVTESRDRVRAAIKNNGFAFPVSRITVNLAPADKKKTGPLYDLPILLAILAASGQLAFDPADCAFLGELALDGRLRPVAGALPMALAAAEAGFSALFLPAANAPEAAVASGLKVYPVDDLSQLAGHLCKNEPITAAKPVAFEGLAAGFALDMADVKGQYAARRGLEIAAAGGHNLLMIGPPGAGKSMLAKRLPGILPPLSYAESIETTKVYSVCGAVAGGSPLMTERPFRAPHHTVSPAGLTGGGSIPRPGEISLAHNGVLFLDELPEFSRTAMEVLRQPLEDGVVTISRVSASLRYPCRFMLVAAMNPCPCGNFGSATKRCSCAPFAVQRYLSKVSGPLLDRLDLHIEVAAVDYAAMSASAPGESSRDIRARVIAARARQAERGESSCNARLSSAELKRFCALTPAAEQTLRGAFEKLALSARAYDKILKVARTIADLEAADTIASAHIAEAVQYRTLDKKYWN